MPPKIKLFTAVLSSPSIDKEYVSTLLAEVFGSADYQGSSHPFDVTTYYQEEMGADLSRHILAFRGPHYADILVGAKLACVELEKGSAIDGKRTINLDVGYLDHNKIVLASTKGAGQRLYLDGGVYADLCARYSKGRYNPFEWSFPDFKDGRYDSDFATLRAMFLKDHHE